MNESTAVAVREVKALLDKAAPEFSRALPAHVPPERFRRIAETAILNNPDVLHANRRSLMSAVIKAAQDGLPPDGRQAALVVFRTKAGPQVQYMPMVAGLLRLARNSGQLAGLVAEVVYEHDTFEREPTNFDAPVTHRPPALGRARGKPMGVYALAKLKDGTLVLEVLDLAQIDQVRQVSRAKDAGPWVSWWSEMARKTAIRRLLKRLPMSTDRDDDMVHRVATRDDEWSGPQIDAKPDPANEYAAALNDVCKAVRGGPYVGEGPDTLRQRGEVGGGAAVGHGSGLSPSGLLSGETVTHGHLSLSSRKVTLGNLPAKFMLPLGPAARCRVEGGMDC